MQYTCLIVASTGAAGGAFQTEFAHYGFKPWLAGSLRRASALLRAWRFDAALLNADDFGPRHVEMLRGLRRESRAPLLLLTQALDEASSPRSTPARPKSFASRPRRAWSRPSCAACSRSAARRPTSRPK